MFTYNRGSTVYEQPTSYSDLYYRSLDNMSRDGFENLGAERNVDARAPSSAALKINAQGGDDVIDLGSLSSAAQGSHTVYGGTGHDEIATGSGNDTIYAGFDNDTAEGGLGADVIYGGSGADVLFGDSLTFDGGGNDQLFGGSGVDVLVGMAGADDLTGGTYADKFTYFNAQESRVAARDEVLDFNRAEGDQFDFSSVDGNLTQSGHQDLLFRAAPSSQAGTFWVEGSGTTWTVFANVDGGAADMAIDVTLTGGAMNLQASDFFI
jgi:Ca2+-binding RTX toxin-like protein